LEIALGGTGTPAKDAGLEGRIVQDLLATVRGARPRVRAAEIIGRRIVSGGLLPGTTLPNFDELAAELSISRLSVREAMRVLADKGLVSSKPRRGTVVQPRSHWSQLDVDVLVWQIADEPDAAFVANLFEVRRIIEPDAAAIVATRGAGATIAALEQALDAMAAADQQSPESIKADLSFHTHLLTGTGNDFIAGFAPLIETLLFVVFRIQRGTRPDPDTFVPGHSAVLEAIKRGDADAARRAATVLLDGAEKDAMNGIRLLAPGAGKAAARSMSQ
jgi:DNA-binding FadR family transcriptional regulator